MRVARRRAYVIIDGSLLRIDRVGMASGNDRPYCPDKHQARGVNAQLKSWKDPPQEPLQAPTTLVKAVRTLILAS